MSEVRFSYKISAVTHHGDGIINSLEVFMQEVIDFLRENKIFYLATIDGNKPKVRPFGFGWLLEDCFRFWGFVVCL